MFVTSSVFCLQFEKHTFLKYINKQLKTQSTFYETCHNFLQDYFEKTGAQLFQVGANFLINFL